MSEKGQSRRFGQVPATSDLPRTTDMVRSARHVSKVPLAEVNALIRSPPGRWRGAFLRGRAVLGGVGASAAATVSPALALSPTAGACGNHGTIVGAPVAPHVAAEMVVWMQDD